jgi:flagellar hook protein FlgE
MLGSIYTGLSGLLGFSKGLDVLSNNIANLNTPGFKGSELAFRDLFYRYGTSSGNGRESNDIGSGVDTPFTRRRFVQGEFRDTGNSMDAGIDGNGFFVLQDKDGNIFYSRAGQFQVDTEGYLSDQTSGARVMALEGGSLRAIQVAELNASAPRATANVTFTGNLSSGSATHDISDITVYDALGTAHTLSVHFTNNSSVTSGSWRVEVMDLGATDPTAVIASGEIRFQGNGSPLTGYNTVTFSYAPSGAPVSTVTLDFGDPNTFVGTTGFSGGTTSTAKFGTQDGYAVGALTSTSFDQDGFLKLSYSNGQTETGSQLALAWFQDLQRLEAAGSGLFVNRTDMTPVVSVANREGMGKISGGKVELSNVDLTEQFTDMVIIQRGYQASSQVTTVANEMLQQLMDIHRRG